MNGSRASRGAQVEYPLVPRTPSEWGTKLLTDAQRVAKCPSEQRLGQSLPIDDEDNRDATIRRIQGEMIELRQVLVPNNLKMSS